MGINQPSERIITAVVQFENEWAAGGLQERLALVEYYVRLIREDIVSSDKPNRTDEEIAKYLGIASESWGRYREEVKLLVGNKLKADGLLNRIPVERIIRRNESLWRNSNDSEKRRIVAELAYQIEEIMGGDTDPVLLSRLISRCANLYGEYSFEISKLVEAEMGINLDELYNDNKRADAEFRASQFEL